MFQNNHDIKLPKVLIVGDSFTNAGGGGVTMTNLFRGWPKTKIAVATTHVVPSGLESCLSYYRLGYRENKRIWPLSYIQPKYPSGPVTYAPADFKPGIITQKGVTSKYNKRFKQLILWLFQITGLTFLENRFKLSPAFLAWINQYKPDLIYTQLATYELIRFTREIKQATNIPVAIHIMDDWPKTLNKPGILYYYWKGKLDHEFRNLLSQSDIFLSICDAMSREYEKRYHKTFYAFHNPIDINRWLPHTKKNWTVNGPFKIIYTGRLGTAVGKSMIELATAITQLQTEGENIRFDIYTFDVHLSSARRIKELKGVTFKTPVSHQDYPALVPQYDLAVLPLDFDEAGLRFVQYSMPTKASEYMISATPVLIYADKRTALANYAIEKKWGYVVSENKLTTLKKAVRILMRDENLRRQLGQTARETAINYENAETVVQNFRRVLSTSIKKQNYEIFKS